MYEPLPLIYCCIFHVQRKEIPRDHLDKCFALFKSELYSIVGDVLFRRASIYIKIINKL